MRLALPVRIFFKPSFSTYRFAATALEDIITARRSALQIANRLDARHLADLDVSAYSWTSLCSQADRFFAIIFVLYLSLA
jgi:hypothetical protein